MACAIAVVARIKQKLKAINNRWKIEILANRCAASLHTMFCMIALKLLQEDGSYFAAASSSNPQHNAKANIVLMQGTVCMSTYKHTNQIAYNVLDTEDSSSRSSGINGTNRYHGKHVHVQAKHLPEHIQYPQCTYIAHRRCSSSLHEPRNLYSTHTIL